MSQIEIEEAVPVLDWAGNPSNFGWARSPYFQYDPSLILSPQRTITGIDRFSIFSPTNIVSFEIQDSGYSGRIHAAVISLKDKTHLSYSSFILFPLGIFELPSSSENGSIKIRQKKLLLDFLIMNERSRILRVDIPQFSHHRILRGEVVLTALPGAESLAVHTPWHREKQAFRYTLCSPCFVTEGVVQCGTTEIVFTKGNAWGIFDWMRGVRPHRDLRFWATASGMNDGRHIGLNIGYSTADSQFGTENAFFLDGRIHKLDQVTFHFSPDDAFKPWRFTSNDNRLEMIFSPIDEITEHNRVLFYVQRQRTIFGSFSGTIILDDGARRSFEGISGIVEDRMTRF
jgi:hypothetical protein